MTLHIVPVELTEANALVSAWHRHHQPSQGHRFSLGVIDADGALHGAAIVGRPVARLAGSPRDVLEVVRLVTDGTPNACSMLYAAAARAGKALGFLRIQTYILDSETGITLRAAGWTNEGAAGGGQWRHTDGRPRRTDQPTETKQRWTKALNERPDVRPVESATDEAWDVHDLLLCALLCRACEAPAEPGEASCRQHLPAGHVASSWGDD